MKFCSWTAQTGRSCLIWTIIRWLKFGKYAEKTVLLNWVNPMVSLLKIRYSKLFLSVLSIDVSRYLILSSLAED